MLPSSSMPTRKAFRRLRVLLLKSARHPSPTLLPSFFFYGSGAHRDLPSFPTRRSSDPPSMPAVGGGGGPGGAAGGGGAGGAGTPVCATEPRGPAVGIPAPPLTAADPELPLNEPDEN